MDVQFLEAPVVLNQIASKIIQQFGFVGFDPWSPKSFGVETSASPKCHCQTLFAMTLAVRVFLSETIQFAR